MKIKLILFLSIFVINGFSQSKFLSGYFMDNNGKKTECLIRSTDSKFNPKSLEYKLTESEPVQKMPISAISAFKILGKSEFVRQNVDVDTSSTSVQNYSSDRNPNYKNKEVFLKKIIEGTYSLYSLEDDNATLFFYNKVSEPVKQLVYKKYIETIESNVVIQENTDFRKQLVFVKCENDNFDVLNKLQYRISDLSSFFVNVNKCNGDLNQNILKENNPIQVKFKPMVATNNQSLSAKIDFGQYRGLYEFSQKSGISFGVEAEFYLLSNKDLWSLFIECSYHKYQGEDSKLFLDRNPNPNVVTAKLTFIQIPLGYRRYFKINNDFKISLDGIVNMRFVDSNSFINATLDKSYTFLAINFSFAAGVGLTYKNASVGFRYFADRDLSPAKNLETFNFKNNSFFLQYAF